MEFRQLNTFVQVARFRSFSKAANELGYSQAAVTIQIRQMEAELGVHLFDRIGKQTTLTHQGEVFYEHAAALLRDLAKAKDAVAGEEELTGSLCLGAIESVCASLLPPVLEEYHRLHPKVSVRIETDSPEMLLERMDRNRIDVVYFIDQRRYDSRWVKDMEVREEIDFVCASSHPVAARAELSLEDLLEQPFLLTEKDASYRFLLDQYLMSKGKQITPFLEIGNTEFIIRLLKTGMGLSFLPAFTVREELREGKLTALPVRDFHLHVWRQIVHHRDKWVSREMAEFIRLARGD